MTALRTYLFLLTLVLFRVWLFFEQSFGFNTLLFSVIAVTMVTIFHKLWHEKRWWLGVCAHLIAAVAVAWHGTDIVGMFYVFSWLILAGLVFSARSSLPFALLNGIAGSVFVSFVAAIPIWVNDAPNSFPRKSSSPSRRLRQAYIYVAPVAVTCIFYLLYSAANPDFLLNINFPELHLDFALLFYTVFATVILSPFVFPWGVRVLTEWDLEKPVVLNRVRSNNGTFRITALSHENKQGVVMFGMLNLLIHVFLGFSICQIAFPSIFPATGNHSEQVHQGFETLIISLIVAIVLIMYYFRGNQNFFSGKGRLVILAKTWLVANGGLVAFTCYKNMLYVNAYGLTYKRIGVFVGLILAGVGLFLTMKKIAGLKTNWYLIRQNTWSIYLTLISLTLVDWDRLITWYNPNFATELDVPYILDLGATKVPYLKELVGQKDPRILPFEAQIQGLVEHQQSSISKPVSWKSQYVDAIWLKRELTAN